MSKILSPLHDSVTPLQARNWCTQQYPNRRKSRRSGLKKNTERETTQQRVKLNGCSTVVQLSQRASSHEDCCCGGCKWAVRSYLPLKTRRTWTRAPRTEVDDQPTSVPIRRSVPLVNYRCFRRQVQSSCLHHGSRIVIILLSVESLFVQKSLTKRLSVEMLIEMFQTFLCGPHAFEKLLELILPHLPLVSKE